MAFAMLISVQCYALTPSEQNEILKSHNQIRNSLNLPNLRWSNSLASKAQSWVNELENSHSCKMKHSRMSGLGENLYWASPIRYSSGNNQIQSIEPKAVVWTWADEKPYYNYSSNSCAYGKVCGHYTQLIWANTTEVGCAKVICANKSQIWSCNYNPPGNYIGQRPY